MNDKLKYVGKEFFMAAVWVFLIMLLILSPGVWAEAIDFVYANF